MRTILEKALTDGRFLAKRDSIIPNRFGLVCFASPQLCSPSSSTVLFDQKSLIRSFSVAGKNYSEYYTRVAV